MDARSNLEKVNLNLQRQLQFLSNLSPSLRGEGIEKANLEAIQKNYPLFYHSLMSAYGHLVALAMVEARQDESTKDKYKSLIEGATHQLTLLWELVSPSANTKSSNSVSKLASDYRMVINHLKSDLNKADSLTPPLIQAHLETIHSAWIAMRVIFMSDENKRSPKMIKRLLSVALANEFITQIEFELRTYALHKAKFVGKDSTEFQVYRDIFSQTDTLVPHLSCQTLHDELKRMIDTLETDGFDDLLACFKEKAACFASSIHTHSSDDCEHKKKRKGSYDSKYASIDTSYGSAFSEGSEAAHIDIQRNMQSHIDESDGALLEAFSRKLVKKLQTLKDRYLGEQGEFAHIEPLLAGLDKHQVLPLREGSSHLAYLQAINPAFVAPALLKKDTDGRLDDDIDAALQQLSLRKKRSESLTSSPLVEPVISMPDHSPSAEDTSSEDSVSSSQPSTRARSTSQPILHSNSHSKSEEEGEEVSRKLVPKNKVEPAPTLLHSSSELSLSSSDSASGSTTTEEVFGEPIPSITRQRSASLIPRQKPKFVEQTDTAPNSVNFMRPSEKLIIKPSLAKKLLIGAGIGLGISAGIALGVLVGYLFIQGGAPLMIAAFAATTKFLGGSSIAAWSATSGILAFPPIAALSIGFKRWQHECRAKITETMAIITKGKARGMPGQGGTTKTILSRSRIVSEPPLQGVRMTASRPSEKPLMGGKHLPPNLAYFHAKNERVMAGVSPAALQTSRLKPQPKR